MERRKYHYRARNKKRRRKKRGHMGGGLFGDTAKFFARGLLKNRYFRTALDLRQITSVYNYSQNSFFFT